MGVTVVKTMHWTCDLKRCTEHGSGQQLPEGWRFIQIVLPGQQKPAGKALACPACYAGMEQRISFLNSQITPAPVPEKDSSDAR